MVLRAELTAAEGFGGEAPSRWEIFGNFWKKDNLNAALYYAKNLSEVKAIVESFVRSGILVTQAKVSLQKSGLPDQQLKIIDQFECLVKLIEKMESAKYAIKEALQNNDISEIINIERQDISPAVYHILPKFSAHICRSRKKLFHVEKTVGQRQKF